MGLKVGTLLTFLAGVLSCILYGRLDKPSSLSSVVPIDFKLFYFDFRGRGESIRFIFAQAGVPYEDTRDIEWMSEKWVKELKPSKCQQPLPELCNL